MRRPAVSGISCRPGQLAVDCCLNANRARSMGARTRGHSGNPQRRGQVVTPRRQKRIRRAARRAATFVTRLLADASAAGFTLDDLLDALQAHRKEDA